MTSATTLPTGEPDRLHALDVLRGIALAGMFLVHFANFSTGGGPIDRMYEGAIALLAEERFWAMFAILFGAGFAIQLRRADSRGRAFVAPYLRRLAALAAFGIIAHACFGFNVLLGYAVWAVPLLFVRRWSVRALVIATVVSAASWNLYNIARTAYGVNTKGEKAVLAQYASQAQANRAFNKANHEAQDATSYRAVFSARIDHMRWFYAQPFSFLPVNTFTLFLLGVIAVRLGLFDAPERHRRMIASLAAFGVVAWAVSTWGFSMYSEQPPGPLLRGMIVSQLQHGFALIRPMWLTFAYMGVVLLLVARNPQWIQRLGAFAWAGRMALTNYMIQIAILDLLFAKYAIGLVVTPLVGMVLAVTLFIANAVASRWWLGRFRYGPLEWLWRSITYARWQPWRVTEREASAGEQLASAG